jgi:NAD(P)-dependent dehydrogenase (short-subunit alcohol dehydrogenase family)
LEETVPENMPGKVCLVTGATFGIGQATAMGIARQGAHVVIAGRDGARSQYSVSSIQKETRNRQVESLLADFSSQAEVRRLAAGFRARHDRLDVLVNNAGAFFIERELTVEGFERTWVGNHLANFPPDAGATKPFSGDPPISKYVTAFLVCVTATPDCIAAILVCVTAIRICFTAVPA